MLVIHARPQPVSFRLSEIVTVPIGNRSGYAQVLTSKPGSQAARRADACLFSPSISSAPKLTSAARGMASFTAGSQSPLFFTDQWHSAVHLHSTQLSFQPLGGLRHHPAG
jgi:hypothetical protein